MFTPPMIVFERMLQMSGFSIGASSSTDSRPTHLFLLIATENRRACYNG